MSMRGPVWDPYGTRMNRLRCIVPAHSGWLQAPVSAPLPAKASVLFSSRLNSVIIFFESSVARVDFVHSHSGGCPWNMSLTCAPRPQGSANVPSGKISRMPRRSSRNSPQSATAWRTRSRTVCPQAERAAGRERGLRPSAGSAHPAAGRPTDTARGSVRPIGGRSAVLGS
jgi:hypothetical protein